MIITSIHRCTRPWFGESTYHGRSISRTNSCCENDSTSHDASIGATAAASRDGGAVTHCKLNELNSAKTTHRAAVRPRTGFENLAAADGYRRKLNSSAKGNWHARLLATFLPPIGRLYG